MISKLAKQAAPIAVLALGVGLAGCSYSVEWDEVSGVPLSEFDQSGEAPEGIKLAGPDQVVITDGDSLSITLDGDSAAGEALRFDRSGNELTIARDQEAYDGSARAVVRIAMPAPSGLTIAGSGEIESSAMASEAEIEIAGSGTIIVTEIDADLLDLDIAGSGSVTAAGSAERLDIDIAGAGNVRLSELTADDVKIDIAGSGNVRLASNGIVDADIAGSGNILVTGSAQCSLSSAGSGTLTCQPADAD
ncbi:MAG: head GIN domain-containing protein [Pseudomonadota bacterium]